MSAPLDLVGQRFGRLTVLERIPSQPGEPALSVQGTPGSQPSVCVTASEISGNAETDDAVGTANMEGLSAGDPSMKRRPLVRWRCRCGCGNIKDYTTGELRSGRTRSCGCRKQEIVNATVSQPIQPKLGMYNGTHTSRISSNRPSGNNKLGLRGVSMTPRGTYVAFIYYQRKRTYLGTFKTPEEAKAAYDEAWKERLEQSRKELEEHNISWQKKERDIIGQRFEKLTVVRSLGDDMWLCRCDCRNMKEVTGKHLISGAVLSCGCLRHVQRGRDLTGKRFGRLVVMYYAGNQRWHCRCDCGNETDVLTGRLNSGHTKSCGCLRHRKRKETDSDDG